MKPPPQAELGYGMAILENPPNVGLVHQDRLGEVAKSPIHGKGGTHGPTYPKRYPKPAHIPTRVVRMAENHQKIVTSS